MLNLFKKKTFKRIISIIIKYYGYLSTFIIGGLTFWFGIDPIKDSKNPYLEFITEFIETHIFKIILFSSFGLLLKILRDKRIEKKYCELKAENTKMTQDLINYSEALKDLSKDILRDFSVEKLNSERGEQMRISLYVKDKDEDLYCLGRYSKNSDFSEFSNTTIYKEKGIIVRAWVDGNNNGYGKFDKDFPRNDTRRYMTAQSRYGLSEDDVRNMKMKSRLYYAYRVEYNGDKLGVILIESLCNNKYTKDFLDGIIKDLESRIILVLNSTFKYLDAPKTYLSNQI